MVPCLPATLHASRAGRSRRFAVAVLNLRLSHLVALLLGIVVCLLVRLPTAPRLSVENDGAPTPRLVDVSGSLRFGPGDDALGALLVYNPSGQVVGCYVDDETPGY